MNRVILLATLTKDVELRYLQSGSAMATLNLAHNKKFKKQDGSQSERVLYVKATCFGKTAEMVNQYFSKGSRILISGELTLNSWADDKGNKRSEHSILIETIDFIDRVPRGEVKLVYENTPAQTPAQVPKQDNKPNIEINQDEIHF